MGQGKQAKILSDDQQAALLWHAGQGRNQERDRVIALLSFKAGLRACEIARLEWGMVTDAYGEIGTALDITNQASKGKGGGRSIPMHADLRIALAALRSPTLGADLAPRARVIYSERGAGMSAATVVEWFDRAYRRLGLHGASSHSGRRTFVTTLARHIAVAGGSLRDVQQLAGHADLGTTQRYIDGSSSAKRAAIDAL